MQFNLLRFLFLLILPVTVIGAVIFGVAIIESYEEQGEYLVPAEPTAHEPAKFSYQLLDPSTNEALRDASVHLEITKTKAINPWLYVGYLRQDNGGTGLVYEMDSVVNDGRIELDTVLWDAGAYSIAIRATSPTLSSPMDITLPVQVKVPLGQIIRTIVLFLAIFLAAVVSGYFAGKLNNPFKKNGGVIARNAQKAMVLLPAIALLSAGIASTASAHGDSEHHETLAVENAGIKAELKVDPAELVQKGAPAHLSLTFTDAATGKPIRDIDASVSLYHADDNLMMFTTRSELPDGQLDFNYAFPDTAQFELIVHASPSSPQSTLAEPFNEKLSFDVPPVQPSVSAQLRAGTLMLIVFAAGFAIGLIGTRRKPSAVLA